MTEYAGGCLCGAIRLRVTGEPLVVSHCHSPTCRRAFGSAFVTWMTARSGQFAFTEGAPRWYRSSAKAERDFCAACDTSLAYRHDDHGDEIDVAVGSLDDPGAVHPRDHLWSGSMLPWLRMDDGLPRLERAHWDHGYPEATE